MNAGFFPPPFTATDWDHPWMEATFTPKSNPIRDLVRYQESIARLLQPLRRQRHIRNPAGRNCTQARQYSKEAA